MSVIGFARCEKLLMKHQQDLAKPRKTWILWWHVGFGHSAIVRTISSSISMPARVTMNLTKLIRYISNLHFNSSR